MDLYDTQGRDVKVRIKPATSNVLLMISTTFFRALMVNLESRESLESQAKKEMLDHQDLRAWLVPMDLQ